MPLQSSILSYVACELRATTMPVAEPFQVRRHPSLEDCLRPSGQQRFGAAAGVLIESFSEGLAPLRSNPRPSAAPQVSGGLFMTTKLARSNAPQAAWRRSRP